MTVPFHDGQRQSDRALLINYGLNKNKKTSRIAGAATIKCIFTDKASPAWGANGGNGTFGIRH